MLRSRRCLRNGPFRATFPEATRKPAQYYAGGKWCSAIRASLTIARAERHLSIGDLITDKVFRWRRRQSRREARRLRSTSATCGARRKQHPLPSPSSPAIISHTTARISDTVRLSLRPAGVPGRQRDLYDPLPTGELQGLDFQSSIAANPVDRRQQGRPDRAESDHAKRHLRVNSTFAIAALGDNRRKVGEGGGIEGWRNVLARCLRRPNGPSATPTI